VSYRCPPLRKCAFWNQTANSWDSRGCETLSEIDGSLTCACSHLTTFAVVQDNVQSVSSTILSAAEELKRVRYMSSSILPQRHIVYKV
jgi:hypothetical protein